MAVIEVKDGLISALRGLLLQDRFSLLHNLAEEGLSPIEAAASARGVDVAPPETASEREEFLAWLAVVDALLCQTGGVESIDLEQAWAAWFGTENGSVVWNLLEVIGSGESAAFTSRDRLDPAVEHLVAGGLASRSHSGEYQLTALGRSVFDFCIASQRTG